MTEVKQGVEIHKAVKKALKPKERKWTFQNSSDREVASTLNTLSASGAVVFGVYQSLSIGGTYGILSYKDSAVEEAKDEE